MPDILAGRMLIFDGCNTTVRNIKLRQRNPNCAVCGDKPTVTAPINYTQFCQGNAHDKVRKSIQLLKLKFLKDDIFFTL